MDKYNVRKLYGEVYITTFPNGLIIPWKPLSLGEYIKYYQTYNRAIILPSVLEDEIFRKCVLDKTLIRQLDFLDAGIIATVVLNIWEYSGPSAVDEFNNDLNTARDILNAPGIKPLHDLVQLIIMAFPYKPEEVYAMEYETFLFRVAQAEKKLLELQVITEPVMMHVPEDIQNQQKKTKVDAKALWDQHQQEMKKKIQHTAPKMPVQQSKKMDGKKWWKTSPVLEAQKKHRINFQREEVAQADIILDNDERATPKEVREFIANKKLEKSREELLKNAQWIYKDLFTEMKKK